MPVLMPMSGMRGCMGYVAEQLCHGGARCTRLARPGLAIRTLRASATSCSQTCGTSSMMLCAPTPLLVYFISVAVHTLMTCRCGVAQCMPQFQPDLQAGSCTRPASEDQMSRREDPPAYLISPEACAAGCGTARGQVWEPVPAAGAARDRGLPGRYCGAAVAARDPAAQRCAHCFKHLASELIYCRVRQSSDQSVLKRPTGMLFARLLI